MFIGSIIGGFAVFTALSYLAVENLKVLKRVPRRIALRSSRIGIGAKFKQIIGFGQIFNTLGAVYGVRFDSNFDSFFSKFAFFDFQLVNFFLPGSCKMSPPIRVTSVSHP